MSLKEEGGAGLGGEVGDVNVYCEENVSGWKKHVMRWLEMYRLSGWRIGR